MALDVAAIPSRELHIDDNGVDRTQIRAMLDLTPTERLRYVTSSWRL